MKNIFFFLSTSLFFLGSVHAVDKTITFRSYTEANSYEWDIQKQTDDGWETIFTDDNSQSAKADSSVFSYTFADIDLPDTIKDYRIQLIINKNNCSDGNNGFINSCLASNTKHKIIALSYTPYEHIKTTFTVSGENKTKEVTVMSEVKDKKFIKQFVFKVYDADTTDTKAPPIATLATAKNFTTFNLHQLKNKTGIHTYKIDADIVTHNASTNTYSAKYNGEYSPGLFSDDLTTDGDFRVSDNKQKIKIYRIADTKIESSEINITIEKNNIPVTNSYLLQNINIGDTLNFIANSGNNIANLNHNWTFGEQIITDDSELAAVYQAFKSSIDKICDSNCDSGNKKIIYERSKSLASVTNESVIKLANYYHILKIAKTSASTVSSNNNFNLGNIFAKFSSSLMASIIADPNDKNGSSPPIAFCQKIREIEIECLFLQPGEHDIAVNVENNTKNLNIKVLPMSKDIDVDSKNITDILDKLDIEVGGNSESIADILPPNIVNKFTAVSKSSATYLVHLSAEAEDDIDISPDLLSFLWKSNKGSFDGQAAIVPFDTTGNKSIELSVSDTSGNVTTETVEITIAVDESGMPSITSDDDSITLKDSVMSFNATLSDENPFVDTKPPIIDNVYSLIESSESGKYKLSLLVHATDDSDTQGLLSFNWISGENFSGSEVEIFFDTTGNKSIELSVSDTSGNVTTETVEITIAVDESGMPSITSDNAIIKTISTKDKFDSISSFKNNTSSALTPLKIFNISDIAIRSTAGDGEILQSNTNTTHYFSAKIPGLEDLPVLYSWNWGDNTSSFGTRVDKKYNNAGSYDVILEVNFGGRIKTKNMTINIEKIKNTQEILEDIFENSEISIRHNLPENEGIEGIDYSFLNGKALDPKIQSRVSYSWDFGDGTTKKGVNLKKSYDTLGKYTITLTAQFGTKTKTITKDISIISRDEQNFDKASFGIHNDFGGVGSIGKNYRLRAIAYGIDSSKITYTWIFEDENSPRSTRAAEALKIYNTTGEHLITLKAQLGTKTKTAYTTINIQQ